MALDVSLWVSKSLALPAVLAFLVQAGAACGQEPRTTPRVYGGAPGELAAGSVLVASRSVDDPNFGASVVLLIEAGQGGAMGVVLNRRTEFRWSDAMPELDVPEEKDDVLFAGGPVEPQRPIFLLRSDLAPADGLELVEGLFLLTSTEAVREAALEPPEGAALRVYVGYAGWAPGQLEAEIDRHDWHVVDVSADWIFRDDTQDLWRLLLDLAFRQTA